MLNTLGQAYVLAVAIYAGNRDKVDVDETSERIYKAINLNPMFHSDEARADVYAQLAEQLTDKTPFAEAVTIIDSALHNTMLGVRLNG